MGWTFTWASSLDSDFNYDFNTSFTEEQQRSGSIDYNYSTLGAIPGSEACSEGRQDRHRASLDFSGRVLDSAHRELATTAPISPPTPAKRRA